jgi:transketolase
MDGADMSVTMTDDQGLSDLARRLRVDVLDMIHEAGSGHPAGALGMADLFAVLFGRVLKYDPINPSWEQRDRLILSNGHTAPILYAAMARAGYFDASELKTLRQFGSRLQGHPERSSLPGLETTSGPLGCGLSQACGMAYSLKYFGSGSSNRVYVVMGDGELDEGNVWEAAMFAAHYRLDNITAIVDRNRIQIDGDTESVMALGDLGAKWAAFGWVTQTVDGNSIPLLCDALGEDSFVEGSPRIVIANTVPGAGVSFMLNDYRWHGRPPSDEEYEVAVAELSGKHVGSVI